MPTIVTIELLTFSSNVDIINSTLSGNGQTYINVHMKALICQKMHTLLTKLKYTPTHVCTDMYMYTTFYMHATCMYAPINNHTQNQKHRFTMITLTQLKAISAHNNLSRLCWFLVNDGEKMMLDKVTAVK